MTDVEQSGFDVAAFATAMAVAAAEKKGIDLAILDMRGLVSYTDMLVLVSGTNPRQVRAIADHVVKQARDNHGVRAVSVEGTESARWVLVDLSDVVVHVFDQSMRGYYDLDTLWGDAKRLPVPAVEALPDEEDDEPLFTLP